MVKRAIAIVLGAAAGSALWFVFDAVVLAPPKADPRAQACASEEMIVCAGYEVPASAKVAPALPAAQPCKAFLSATGAAPLQQLSACLHETARAKQDAQMPITARVVAGSI